MNHEWLRRRIEAAVLDISMSPGNPVAIDFTRPPGDPGLFGPGSASWEVHSDFTSMFAGGVTALLLQALHPRVLAGVWDHSDFRADMLGRLRRTAQFIAGTTFGSRADAERLIERVRAIHGGVRGVTADGQPYRADDPDLLAWVHVAEVSSFLDAYVRYRDPAYPPERQEQYLREYARVAHALGARHVPASREAVRRHLLERRGELRCDGRTREIVRCILDAPAPGPAARAWSRLVIRAGFESLPGWALEMLGRKPLPAPARRALDAAVLAAARPLRWAVRNGSVHRARRRAAAASGPPH